MIPNRAWYDRNSTVMLQSIEQAIGWKFAFVTGKNSANVQRYDQNFNRCSIWSEQNYLKLGCRDMIEKVSDRKHCDEKVSLHAVFRASKMYYDVTTVRSSRQKFGDRQNPLRCNSLCQQRKEPCHNNYFVNFQGRDSDRERVWLTVLQFSEQAKSLVRGLLSVDPKQRFGVQDPPWVPRFLIPSSEG